MNFRAISLQPSTDKNEMRNDKIYAGRGEMKKNENNKNKVSWCKLGDYCLKRMLYWLGIGF